jgi:hypothetical protein
MPRIEAPAIDERTYIDLVAEVEELIQQYTAGAVTSDTDLLDADLLTGVVLDEKVDDLEFGNTYPAGTLVSRSLAERLAQIPGLGPVTIRGWQPLPDQVRVEATLANLVGAVLGEDLVESPQRTIPKGTLIDEDTAERILGIPVDWVWLDLQPDAGWALARIFSRMAELVVTRLNRLPDRNFLAFLDLIGTRLNPPQPARVPLTFVLAAGSPVDALAPAGTQAAAVQLEGEAEPPLFETERDLVVTRSQLAAVYSREPGRDLWADHTAIATGQSPGVFWPFRGDRRIEHRLHVAHPLLGLPEEKTIELRIRPADADHPWLSAVTWTYWNGAAWLPLEPYVWLESGAWVMELADVPGIAASAVSGNDGFWLHGRLEPSLARAELVQVGQETELRRRGIQPAAAFTKDKGEGELEAVDLAAPFFPFGEEPPVRNFYLSAGTGFTKPGSAIVIDVALDTGQPPEPTDDLTLTWEYLGDDGWKELAGAEFTPATRPDEGAKVGPFLVDGTLRFPRPDDWTPGKLDGVDGYWLQAWVFKGSFGTPPDYHPPRVERLTLGEDWRLPRIDSLSVRVTIERAQDLGEDFVPERGFANQVPLDLSKDFLPFGEKPKIGDVFYLASDEAFSKPGAEVQLYVNLTTGTPPGASEDLRLTWEFWNGREWQLLGHSGESGGGDIDFEDDPDNGTNGFRQSGRVGFTVPPALAATEVNGEVRRWVRARIARGNYGVEARYVPVMVEGQPRHDENGLPIYELVPATFKPPSLRSIRLGYLYDSGQQNAQSVLTENDFAFADVSIPAQTAGATFTPFLPSADLQPTLYLGFDRPGDAIGFANRATALFFWVSEALYDPAVEQGSVTEEASVVWEYWNGEFWERLGIRDETRGLARRGLVTFLGPPDFRASADFGRMAFWLRGRWERGDYAVEPRLVRILTNTTWAVHAQTIRGEVLGSSRGERGQVFRTLRAAGLDGQQLEVIEPDVPLGAELAELEAEEGDDAVTVVRDAAGQFVEVRVRWHEVPDFYGSGPRSRHYVLDHATGEVRFGDGRRGLVPPPGRNNVRLLRYRAGGGLAGNRPAGSIAQLKGTVPYVDGVVQHLPAEGGAAEESLEAARSRGPKGLRHRDRATAAVDFEDLAFQATPEVARARALPARRGSEGGQVGLIVVPAAADAKPVPGLELLARVRSYVEARLSPVVDFWVVGPDWLQMDVRAEVVPHELEAAADVQTAILERLRAFLHPLYGGPLGEGWEFGRKPQRSDLYALIEETPGVDHVRRLEVIETPREGGARRERFLVFSGDHEIILSGNVDDAAEQGSLP